MEKKKLSDAQAIGIKGRALFELLLPSGWVPHSEDGDGDFGVDQTLEVFLGGEATGMRCFVQIKSTENAKHRANSISKTLKVKDLNYWNSKQLATFIVLVDLEGKEFYWLEAHDVVKSLDRTHSTWRSQDSVVVSFPKENKSTKIEGVWPDKIRNAPAMISLGHYGFLSFPHVRESLGESLGNPQTIKARQGELSSIQSGLNIESCYQLQEEGKHDEAVDAAWRAWEQARESDNPESIAVAAKVVLLTGNPISQETGPVLFQIATDGAKAARNGVHSNPLLEHDAEFLEGMSAVLLGHKLVRQLIAVMVQDKMVGDSDGPEKFLAGHAKNESAQQLNMVLESIAGSLDRLQELKNYLLLAELLRYLGVLQYVLASHLWAVGQENTELIREIADQHVQTSIELGKALGEPIIEIQGLLDIATSHGQFGDVGGAKDLVKQVEKIASATGSSGHDSRIAIVRKQIQNPPQKSTRNPDDYSEDEKDTLMRYLLESSGFNLDEPQNDFDRAVLLGLQDRNPERVLKWCKHLEVEILSTSMLGRSVGLDSLGQKMMHCAVKSHTELGVGLDTLLTGFQNGPCFGCPDRVLRDDNWAWTEKWARENNHSESMAAMIRNYRSAR